MTLRPRWLLVATVAAILAGIWLAAALYGALAA